MAQDMAFVGRYHFIGILKPLSPQRRPTMFRQKEWSFTGASGTIYVFSMRPKSDGLPQSAGVYIQAYTRPRGHMAGWLAG
jgi:hypothetical protein